ncbi:FadR/GntR family transcriptional regulator [Novibacillus thermophilus]|uniref:HTH gntR-type domain-containing protein n=1 Tax=Novibacillus thermophilus TaxID=1471761 RepID=A0A1U9K5W8_9BACL|nr:FadR/GntR family transcriptional regulator [Novibacillus thermophilus]AQS55416.1 hypothetical protein B0W44_06060 [Novibacillus thermophilus]
MFKPLVDQRTNITDRIVDYMKQLIYNGELKPGEKLPPERELANMLNVSRTPMREALKILSAMGYIHIRHGHGLFVADPDEAVISQLANAVSLKRHTLMDLFDVRLVLEAQAAKWAAARRTDDELKNLHAIVAAANKDMRDLPDPDFATRNDHAFHYAIAQASHNSVILRIMNSLLDLMKVGRQHALSIPGRFAQSVKDHEKIVHAIEAQQPDKAHEAMRHHIQDVRRDVLSQLAEQNEDT